MHRSTVVLLLVAAASNALWAQVGAGGNSSDNFQVQYDWEGRDVKRFPRYDPGVGWHLVTETEQWHTRPQANPLSTVAAAPADLDSYDLASTGVCVVRIRWCGEGAAPQDVYVRFRSFARGLYTYLVGGQVEASDGLGDLAGVEQGIPSDWSQYATSAGTRLVRVTLDQGEARIPLTVSASANGRAIQGGNLGRLERILQVSAEIVDRSVGLRSDRDPTTRRAVDALGHPFAIQNEPDHVGNMYGDIGIEPRLVGGRLEAPFEYTMFRTLQGAWNLDDLYNQWWNQYPAIYRSDGLFSEIEWLPVHGLFSPAPNIPVDALQPSGFLDRITYSVDDQVDEIHGEAKYTMRIHLPLEKTGDDWKPAFEGPLWENPDVGTQYPKFALVEVSNVTSQPITVTVRVERTRTYTYLATFQDTGGLQIGHEVLRVLFGSEITRSTSESWALGTVLSSSVTIPPNGVFRAYAVPVGRVEYPVGALYSNRGYVRDSNGVNTRPMAPIFRLEMAVTS